MDVIRAPGLLTTQRQRLSADAAAGLENAASARVSGVAVKQFWTRVLCLVLEAQVFTCVVTVHVLLEHCHRLDHLHEHLRGMVRVIRASIVVRGEGGSEPVPQLRSPLQIGLQLGQVHPEGGGGVGILRVKQRDDLAQAQSGLAQRHGPVKPRDFGRAVTAVPGGGPRGGHQPDLLPVAQHTL